MILREVLKPFLKKGMGRWDDDIHDKNEDEPLNKKSRTGESSFPDRNSAIVNASGSHREARDNTKRDTFTTGKHSVPMVAAQAQDQVLRDSLLNGCRSVDNYQPLNFIDQGSFGMVFRAKCLQSGKIYAIKQVKLGSSVTSKFGFPITALREANVLQMLDHPSIVKLREIVYGSTMDKIYFVMEHVGQDLREVMSLLQKNKSSGPAFSLGEIKQLFAQLLSAVAYLHKHSFIHRDIKTTNLLYAPESGRLTLCDFGLARRIGNKTTQVLTFEVVTLWYRDPALLLGERAYGSGVDIWSCGCILGELLSGNVLLPGQGEVDQMRMICALLGTPTERDWSGVTQKPNYALMIGDKIVKSGDKPIGDHAAAKSSDTPLKDCLELRQIKQRFHHARGGAADTMFLSEVGCDLLASLMRYDPSLRIAARAALDHPWLKEQPVCTPAALMPTVFAL